MHVSKVPRIFYASYSYQCCGRHLLRGRLNHTTFISDEIWELKRKRVLGKMSYVFLPLFESVDEHLMLFVADVKGRWFLVYELLATRRAPRVASSGVLARVLTLVMLVLRELNTPVVLDMEMP